MYFHMFYCTLLLLTPYTSALPVKSSEDVLIKEVGIIEDNKLGLPTKVSESTIIKGQPLESEEDEFNTKSKLLTQRILAAIQSQRYDEPTIKKAKVIAKRAVYGSNPEIDELFRLNIINTNDLVKLKEKINPHSHHKHGSRRNHKRRRHKKHHLNHRRPARDINQIQRTLVDHIEPTIKERNDASTNLKNIADKMSPAQKEMFNSALKNENFSPDLIELLFNNPFNKHIPLDKLLRSQSIANYIISSPDIMHPYNIIAHPNGYMDNIVPLDPKLPLNAQIPQNRVLAKPPVHTSLNTIEYQYKLENDPIFYKADAFLAENIETKRELLKRDAHLNSYSRIDLEMLNEIEHLAQRIIDGDRTAYDRFSNLYEIHKKQEANKKRIIFDVANNPDPKVIENIRAQKEDEEFIEKMHNAIHLSKPSSMSSLNPEHIIKELGSPDKSMIVQTEGSTLKVEGTPVPLDIGDISEHENRRRKLIAAELIETAAENLKKADQIKGSTKEESEKRLKAAEKKVSDDLRILFESQMTDRLNEKNLENYAKATEQYRENLKSNMKIAEEASNKIIARSQINNHLSHPHQILNHEQKEASKLEEEKAIEAINRAIAKAGEIARENVLENGGSLEQAEMEAMKTRELKKEDLRKELIKNAEENFRILSKQMDAETARVQAHHIALAHTGGKAIGNTVDQIHDEEIIAAKHTMKALEKERPQVLNDEEVLEIISSNADRIDLKNSKINFPIETIPDIKAQTKEEEELKLNQENLRDSLRNKITKNGYNSGLIVIKTEDGFLNLPESAQELQVAKGKAYFTREAVNEMKAKNIDISALKAVISEGNGAIKNSTAYYEAEVNDMSMKLPNPNNPDPIPILSNGNSSLVMKYASSLDVEEGAVKIEPLKEYSDRNLRPMVYNNVNNKEEIITEQEKIQIREQDARNLSGQAANSKVYTNNDGKEIVEITPNVGVKQYLDIEEAEKMHSELKQEEEDYFNLDYAADEKGEAYRRFMEKTAEKIRKSDKLSSLISEFNPLTNRISQTLLQLKKKSTEKIEDYFRTGESEENRVYNNLIRKSEEFAKELNMSASEFREAIKILSTSNMSEMIEFAKELQKVDHNDLSKIFMKIKDMPFFSELKTIFNDEQLTTVIKNIFSTLNSTLGLRDRMNENIIFKISLPNIMAPSRLFNPQNFKPPAQSITASSKPFSSSNPPSPSEVLRNEIKPAGRVIAATGPIPVGTNPLQFNNFINNNRSSNSSNNPNPPSPLLFNTNQNGFPLGAINGPQARSPDFQANLQLTRDPRSRLGQPTPSSPANSPAPRSFQNTQASPQSIPSFQASPALLR